MSRPDDKKPEHGLFEILSSQGMQTDQQVTFLTDGGEDIRDLPLYLSRVMAQSDIRTV
ncbi:MAG: hypothetical protein JO364_17420 [Pseudonocardiales bacterium]|nr:hypothetical protein [Pseudonocardiales bacterium]MBV9032042.1 hypothetical protein [Pseudonocardiales bacterium]